MRKFVSAAMAVFALFGAGSSLAGHGGGHVVVHTVYVPGSSGPVYTGLPAYIEWVMDAAKPAGGAFGPGDVIGVRTAHAEDAIVLTEPLKDNGIEVDAGTVMVRTTLKPRVLNWPNVPAKPVAVWCSLRKMPAMHLPTQDCLRDSKSSGKLDQFWTGYIATRGAPVTLIGLSPGRTVADTGYRKARPDELPVLEIGYRFCSGEGDGLTRPLRFNSVLRAAGGESWAGESKYCPFGDWPELADKSVETVDGLKMHIQPGVSAPPFAQSAYQMIQTLPAGPLDPVYAGLSVRPRGAMPVALARLKEAVEAGEPLRPIGPGKASPAGMVAHGATLAEIPVQHGITGVLRYDFDVGALWTAHVIPAGHYAFGVPTRNTSDIENPGYLTWCLPDASADPAKPVSTICISNDGYHTYENWLGDELMATSLTRTSYMRTAGAFSVERKPGTFPLPMTLVYVFDHWVALADASGRRAPYAQLGVEIHVNGVMTPMDHILVSAGPHGFRLPVAGGELALIPVNKDGRPVGGADTPPAKDEMVSQFDLLDVNRAELEVVMPLTSAGHLPFHGVVNNIQPPPPLQIAPRPTVPAILPAPPVLAPVAASTTAPAAP